MTKKSYALIISLLLVAATLFSAVPAEAHGEGWRTNGYTKWTCISHYESTHRWFIEDGGLQIIDSTWVTFGGRRYASEARYAKRWEQRSIGRNIGWRGNWKYQRTNGDEGHPPQGMYAWAVWPRCR